jgi:DNA-binding NarL/FixJ family response regulator
MTTSLSLLLIDDNPVFLRHVTRFVERDDALHVAGRAETVQTGLRTADQLQPDVILLDLSLPDGNGLDAIADLREAAPHARIVVLTMQDATVYRERARAEGADAFVAKRDLVTDLIDAIHAPGAAA